MNHRPLLPLLCAFLLAVLLGPHEGLRAQVVAYHDVSSASHQTQFNTLSGQGYRITSFSVAGGLSAPRYSAIWEQVSGPGWVSLHDMSAAQYTTTRATWISQGYRAKLVTAAGSGTNTVVAAVFVNDGASVTESIDAWQVPFENACASAQSSGRIPASVDVTGAAPYHKFWAVFEPNPSDKVWGYNIDLTSTEFTVTRNAHDEGNARPACIGMSEDQSYVSAWYDDRVGNWVVRNNYTSSGWQTVFSSWTGNGYYPRIIASGGSGTSLRFAGSFAERRTPLPRTLTITGQYRSQFAAFDTYMTDLLQNKGTRAGAMAIAKDGKLVYARGFTWAESGYHVTQPADVFRIASCSKPLTAIATHKADEQGHLAMTTGPASALGLAYTDSRFANIDIKHTLLYSSGIVRNFDAWTVAQWWNPSSPTLPVTMQQLSQWVAQQGLLYTPGLESSYSNAAFTLPAEVIRVRTGQSYQSYLQSQVLAPLGITRIKVGASELSQLTSTDVFPHLTELRTLPSERYNDRRRKSEQFVKDLSLMQAEGGMASSTVDYVRFLSGIFDLKGQDSIVLNDNTVDDVLQGHMYPDHANPLTFTNTCLGSMFWSGLTGGGLIYSKNGGLASTSNESAWRTDGISWAIFVNKGSSGPNPTTINNMLNGITSWPAVDEFPNYGLPAYPQRPLVTSVTPSSLNNMTTSHFVVTGKRLDTVTSVVFGFHQITSTSPSQWQHGYFVRTSPTQLEVHPPQGLSDGTYPLAIVNSAGGAQAVNVSLTLNPTLRIGAPTVVQANQQWSAYVSRGTLSLVSNLSLVMLAVSTSGLPSSAPGVVTLGLGNQFGDLLLSGAVTFDQFTNLARFDLPALPSGSSFFLEAVAIDFADPSIFPLPTSNTVQVTRQ